MVSSYLCWQCRFFVLLVCVWDVFGHRETFIGFFLLTISFFFRFCCFCRPAGGQRARSSCCISTPLAFRENGALQSLTTRSPIATSTPDTSNPLHPTSSYTLPCQLSHHTRPWHLTVTIVACSCVYASVQFWFSPSVWESFFTLRFYPMFSLHFWFSSPRGENYLPACASRLFSYASFSLDCSFLWSTNSTYWRELHVKN